RRRSSDLDLPRRAVALRRAGLDEALPAVGRDGHRRVVAEVRDLDALVEAELEELRPRLELVGPAVDDDLRHRKVRNSECGVRSGRSIRTPHPHSAIESGVLRGGALEPGAGGAEDERPLRRRDGGDLLRARAAVLREVAERRDVGLLDGERALDDGAAPGDVLREREHVALLVAGDADAEGDAGLVLEREPAPGHLAHLRDGAGHAYGHVLVLLGVHDDLVDEDDGPVAGVLADDGAEVGDQLVVQREGLLVGGGGRPVLGAGGEEEGGEEEGEEAFHGRAGQGVPVGVVVVGGWRPAGSAAEPSPPRSAPAKVAALHFASNSSRKRRMPQRTGHAAASARAQTVRPSIWSQISWRRSRSRV